MRLVGILAATVLLLGGTSAGAVQFTPSGTARLHTLGSGQPGAEWDTQGLGNGGQISYDSGTGLFSTTALLQTLNFFDPAGGAAAGVTGSPCTTDAGSNCAFNYGSDVNITFTASIVGLTVTPIIGTFVNIQVDFESTGGVDLSVVDSSDGATLFEASLAAGTFQGSPTTGMSASVVFDTGTGMAVGAPPVTGISYLQIDPSALYAGLFLPDFFALQFASLQDFANGGVSGGGLNELLADSLIAGALQSFTAEANGQVFRTASGDFIAAEPGALMLVASFAGTLGLWARGQRRNRRS